jgi:hypothetical protein
MTVQVQKLHRDRPSPAYARAATYDAPLEGGVLVQRWPRRSRFLFIVGAASLSWALPAAIVYWLVALR